MNIGSLVKRARKKASLTQEQLAEKVGIGQTQIANIEKGRCTPSFKLAMKLIDLFGPEIFLRKGCRSNRDDDHTDYKESELEGQRKRK